MLSKAIPMVWALFPMMRVEVYLSDTPRWSVSHVGYGKGVEEGRCVVTNRKLVENAGC